MKAIPTTSKKHFIFSFSINIEHAEDSYFFELKTQPDR